MKYLVSLLIVIFLTSASYAWIPPMLNKIKNDEFIHYGFGGTLAGVAKGYGLRDDQTVALLVAACIAKECVDVANKGKWETGEFVAGILGGLTVVYLPKLTIRW